MNEYTSIQNKEIEDILVTILGENATGIYCFAEEIDSGDGYGDFFSTVNEKGFGWSISETDNISIASGVTRLVLIPEDKDYVIKLPIMEAYTWFDELQCIDDGETHTEIVRAHSSEEDWYLQEDEREWTIINSYFETYITKIADVDLMEKENQFTELTPELSKVLLPNIYQGMWHGIPVYIQKKVVELDGGSIWNYRSNTSHKIHNLCDNYMAVTNARIPSYEFFESLYKRYGADFTRKVLHDLHTNELDYDLHGRNVGYLEDGSPVIFDYAGFDFDDIYYYN